jgi:signal transduction histidine kinase
MIEARREDLGVFLTEDAKGRHIPSYLIKAANLLVHEQDDVMAKLETLVHDVHHIKTIIRMQQEYAKVSGIPITTTVENIVEDAVRINQTGLELHHIQIRREYALLGELTIDKQRVMQILVNLIGNAKSALVEQDNEEKTITLRTSVRDDAYLCIEVTDNGVGIMKAHLDKVFRHGFTTKKDGHGFGLHSGALAAKEMNGSLKVHSDGPGHGATFTLELPFKSAGVETCTT